MIVVVVTGNTIVCVVFLFTVTSTNLCKHVYYTRFVCLSVCIFDCLLAIKTHIVKQVNLRLLLQS